MAEHAYANVFDLESFRERRKVSPRDVEAAKNWLWERIERGNQDGPFAEVGQLDHGIAVELLQNNHANRRIRTSKLAQYVEDMRNGRWMLNGETIIVSKEGQLLDGQHRCFAALNVYDAPACTFLFGIEEEARKTLDIGAKRLASDILSLHGIPNGSLVSSMARMIISLEQGKRRQFVGRDRISTSLIVERVMDDAKLRESAEHIHKMKRAPIPGVTVGVAGTAYHLLRKRSQEQAYHFIQEVFTHMPEPRVARVTRDRLFDLAGTGGRERRLEVLVRGWNMLRSGDIGAIPMYGEMPKIV